jgi:hypothetical protein
MGRPIWREDVSVFCVCYWPLSAQSFSGPSPLGLATIFYCLRFENSLFVASYDSQGHGVKPNLGLMTRYLTRILFCKPRYVACARNTQNIQPLLLTKLVYCSLPSNRHHIVVTYPADCCLQVRCLAMESPLPIVDQEFFIFFAGTCLPICSLAC